MSFVVVIPSYNEENNLDSLLKEILGITSNIIVINDGSTDKTEEICRKNKVNVINNVVNKGKGYSLRLGLQYAKKKYPHSDWVITMDGDGQHSPKDIPKLVKSVIQKQLLILIGNRSINENSMSAQPHKRYLANVATTKFVNKIFKINISDLQSGFRIYHQKITPYLIKGTKSTKFQFETEILLEAWALNITIGEEKIVKIYYPSLPSRIKGVEDTLKWISLVFLRLVYFPKKYSQRRNNKKVIWEIWKELSN